MRIYIGSDEPGTIIDNDDSNRHVMLTNVFEGVDVRTDAGIFKIYQVEGGIEIFHRGELVFSFYRDDRGVE